MVKRNESLSRISQARLGPRGLSPRQLMANPEYDMAPNSSMHDPPSNAAPVHLRFPSSSLYLSTWKATRRAGLLDGCRRFVPNHWNATEDPDQRGRD